MKINSVTNMMHAKMVNNKSDRKLDTHMNVNRVPSHRDNVNYLVKVLGEKELKHFGVLECRTCAKRMTNQKSHDSGDRHEHHKKNDEPSIRICRECGRTYTVDGETNEVKLGEHIYDPSLEFFEGLKLDERL